MCCSSLGTSEASFVDEIPLCNFKIEVCLVPEVRDCEDCPCARQGRYKGGRVREIGFDDFRAEVLKFQ